jgi:hypothetical protein
MSTMRLGARAVLAQRRSQHRRGFAGHEALFRALALVERGWHAEFDGDTVEVEPVGAVPSGAVEVGWGINVAFRGRGRSVPVPQALGAEHPPA